MNNLIHLHGCPFSLARPEVKTIFNQKLEIYMIDTPNKIRRPKVQNRYIPLDYSDDIYNGSFDYHYYGKSIFRTNFDRKAHTRNDIITYNHEEDWN